MATYKIHPGIGIARLGNSDTEFYLAPEMPAGVGERGGVESHAGHERSRSTALAALDTACQAAMRASARISIGAAPVSSKVHHSRSTLSNR